MVLALSFGAYLVVVFMIDVDWAVVASGLVHPDIPEGGAAIRDPAGGLRYHRHPVPVLLADVGGGRGGRGSSRPGRRRPVERAADGDAGGRRRWHGLGGYSAEGIRALKDRVDGGIYVSGSGTLVRAMLAEGLVDELHLFVYPVVLGTGVKLFGDSQVKFTLAQTRSYDNGVLHLGYRPAA